MTAATYRVVHTDPSDGTIREDLTAVDGISFTETLNAEGAATVTVPLYAPEANPATLYPNGSGIAILRDEVPVWGGILRTLSADLNAGTLTLNSTGYHSYYKGRVWTGGYNSAGPRDQADLLASFIEGSWGGGIGTDTSRLTSSGRRRTRQWTKYEFKIVADAIEELAEDEGGFNFRYEPYWDAGRIAHRIIKSDLGGAPLPFSLVHLKNCDVTKVDYDGSNMATHTYAVGADVGNGSKLVGIAENAELAAVMPIKRVVATFQDLKETEELIGKAGALLNIGRAPVAIPTLTVYPGLYSPADFIPGDSGVVQVDSGYVALYDDFVITERKTDVNANGGETITLSLANRELFVNGQSS